MNRSSFKLSAWKFMLSLSILSISSKFYSHEFENEHEGRMFN